MMRLNLERVARVDAAAARDMDDSADAQTPRTVGSIPWAGLGQTEQEEWKSEDGRSAQNEDEWMTQPAWARVRTPSPDMSYYGRRGYPPPPPSLLMPMSFAPQPYVVPTICTRQSSHNGSCDLACQDDAAPSVGSRGHPHRCNKPCKYFMKARGCKDGANCDRCHLCTWVKESKSRHKGRKSSAESSVALELDPSLQTIAEA